MGTILCSTNREWPGENLEYKIMKFFKIATTNASTDVTIESRPSEFYKSEEITEKKALELLYAEVDPAKDYPITDYKLIYSESLNRYGITYK